MELSEQAVRILESRYLLKDNEGTVVETPEKLFRRVTKAIAEAESCGEQAATMATRFYSMMSSLSFLPNSPTLMNAGAPIGQLSACFVLPIDDNMESIFRTVADLATIFKSGGGVGLSFSRLRPNGDLVKSTGGKSSGPVSFMRVFDSTADVVSQGGKRRGALMGTLRVDHPDILDFIRAKQDLSKLNCFNTSVAVTDRFMEAVERDEPSFGVVNPRDDKITTTYKAKEIWKEIVKCAWRTGEPGLVFIDRINAFHTEKLGLGNLGQIESTNPCVTGDTWTMTKEGPRRVESLVGSPCWISVGGTDHLTDGFFSSGRKNVFKVKTDIGIEVDATADHMFVRTSAGLEDSEKVLLSDLEVGDILPVDVGSKQWYCNEPFRDQDAYLVGLWFGDGSMKRDKPIIYLYDKTEGIDTVVRYIEQTFGAKSLARDATRQLYRFTDHRLTDALTRLGVLSDKVITSEIEFQSYAFYASFLRGFFDTDGSVQGTVEHGFSIRLSQSNLPRIQAVQRMLLRMGIFSRIRLAYPPRSKLMPDGKGGKKKYKTKANYELIITSESVFKFVSEIGFLNQKKNDRSRIAVESYSRGPYQVGRGARVVSIKPVGRREVYDVRVPGVNVFNANGLVVANCGEQPLVPYESCNLGSINLANMVLQDAHGAFVDDASLITTVETAVRFLDNVIDVNNLPLPQISEATLRSRKIGLGVMGFAEMLIKLGVPYYSDEALSLAKRVSKFISEAAHKASKELAKERGPFPAGDGSPGCFRRNATLTTIAPTGTISMIAGVTGGIEPIFAVGLKHQNILDGATFTQVHPLFVQHAYKYEYWSQGLMEAIADGELLASRTDVPFKARRLFETAHEISPGFHVKMQAAWQGSVDNAVSKTVNLPNSATEEDVEYIFRCAWDLGCKGVTVYRDGCREDQPMTTAKKDHLVREGSSDVDPAKVADGRIAIIEDGYIKPDDRPDVLPGKTYKMRTGCGTLFVTVSQGSQGRIVEMFAHHGKAGVCSQAQCEAIGRLTSLALRSHVDPMEVAKQLAGITCHVTHGFGERKVLSCADGIGKVLLRLIKETSDDPNATNVKLEGSTTENPEPASSPDRSGACPDCGAALVREANCTVCKVCGYERCT